MKTASRLITDVQVKSATAADKDFLEGGIEGSAEVTGTFAEHVNADGAYQSDGNRDFAADNLIDFVTSGLQGKPSRYDLTLNDDGLTVVDKAMGDVIPVTRAKDKWRIATDSKAKYRYFTPEQVEKALLRKRLEAIPKKELDRRNNVGGGHVPNQLSHAQQQDSLSGTCQACHVGLLQMPVDKLHQIDDFPDNNMSKNYFHPFSGLLEVYAEPFDSYRRISAQPSLYF